ncbi:MAG: amidase family protein, partial [Myxococcota bacterium]
MRDRFAQARDEARAADARVQAAPAEDLPPLHGVPCTIKECFALTGMPNSSGLVARRGVIAQSDATTVARLRRAGAIPLGVTNVSELCMWMETHNRVYGRTRNPYDPSRIVGGSSGGEGAIVGAGGSPFGLGSDIGGSIRMPAFFCGVFGHKPTGGLVPGTGQYPLADEGARRYLTTGPLARRAEDLMPLLRILAGPDGEDGGCTPMPLGDPADVPIEGLRVLSVADDGLGRVSADLREAQERAARALEARGAIVERARIRELRWSLGIWSSMLGTASDTPFSQLLGNGTPVRVGYELARFVARRSPHTL